MRNKYLIVLLVCLLLTTVLFIVGCSGNTDSTNDGGSTSKIEPPDENDPTKLNFTGITFEDLTVTYDGDGHILPEAQGVPANATVTYTGRTAKVNAGTYAAKAKISASGYNDLTLNATLTINKAILTGVSFEDETFDYDGLNHSIYVTGSIPTTATVVYTSDVDNIRNTASEVGTYNITATITDMNYENLVLNAVLKINVENKQRLMMVSEDTLYFDNAKDHDYLYAFNFDDEEIIKIESGTPKDMAVTSNNNIVYVSGASILSSIKTASYDSSATDKTSHNSLINENAQYIQYGGGNVYYYVINGLTNNKSGIYKIDLTDADNPVKTLLSVGKAKYLKLVGSNLYFADGANGSKLSKINTTDSEQSRTAILNGEDEVKINNLYTDGTRLYFTVNATLGNYLSNYTISTGVFKKLTCDAASEMVVMGDDLYYINVDKFTTTFIGNGIYKVDKNPSSNNSLPGTKVIDDPGEGLTSLTASRYGFLFYYDVSGYKLMYYNGTNEDSGDILDTFVAPEDPTPITLGGQSVSVNGVVYYLDIWDGKTLHMYNPQTNANFRMTADKVKEFSIIGDYIYLNIVTTGVNNSTYRVNIKTNDVPELVNTVDAVNIVSDGTYIYYIKNNALGAATEIHRAKMDGTEDVTIYEYAASYMYLYNTSLYFVGQTSGTSYNYILKLDNVSTITTPVARSTSLKINDDARGNYMYLSDGIIYFNNTKGTNSLSRINVDGTNLVKIVDNGNVDIGQIIVDGNYIYYCNRYNSKNDYDVYKVSKNATAGTPTKLTTGMHPYGACICGGKIYYVDYYSAVLGDSHLYSVSVDGGTPELIA